MWTFTETIKIEQNFGRWTALITLHKNDTPESFYLNFGNVEPSVNQVNEAGTSYALKKSIEESPEIVITNQSSEFILREIFFARFTNKEIAAIYRAMNSNDNLFAYVKKLEITPSVRLAHPDIVNGLNMLEAVGLIGVGRSNEILQG